MFGYVTVNQSTLSDGELARYRRVYCGVCAELRDRCGSRGRMTLTYDAAFLALLLSSLYEPEENRSKKRCPAHLLRTHDCETGAMTGYAADINIILFYYSCLDGWKDDGSRIKRDAAKLLEKAFAAAKARQPEKARTIEKELDNLSEIEKNQIMDIDGAAGCFGRLLGEVFAVKDDLWKDALYKTGDALGRFIYIMDALDDAEKDKKTGSYNPLAGMTGEPDFENRVYEMLRTEMALCARALETLPLVQDIGIIRNIIYSGVWTRYSRRKAKLGRTTDGN